MNPDQQTAVLWAERDHDGTTFRATRRIDGNIDVRAERPAGFRDGRAWAIVAEMWMNGVMEMCVDDRAGLRRAIIDRLRAALDDKARRCAPPVSCPTLAERYRIDCCSSCHHDWDSGYDEPSLGRLPDGTPVESCCAVRIALQERGVWRPYHDAESANER